MIKRIRELQHARAFVPYEIELSSGKVIPVTTPDHASSRHSGPGYVAVWDDNDNLHTIVALHIIRVSTTQPQPS